MSATELAQLPYNSDLHNCVTDPLRQRGLGIWLLDFNQCRSRDDQSFDWTHQLVKAFFFNDPYYPSPVSDDDDEDAKLWTLFEREYLAASSGFTNTDDPTRFIGALKAEAAVRRERARTLGQGSLFTAMMV
ncbi:uncharacterized protein HMPREF1541_08121 [Cyphellophora europaea CBS 101466]|uniref:DUF3669 domain-containing protein n=1 Tax=Cyphellophora europaea (strain CBS 101466) TaxID=1220924 RepID=W2RKW4_CYPE1|nr:uncharacterized protein HMPREF1541_08121 [Cyphellophora europaea CBS 101466]ETN37131.1 hypothetical protein HMPREF1541_08121 [Cyphellophora europaea CBS 101466]